VSIKVSGFLALLDDVAAIAKLAAAQVDDIAAHAAKAGGKSAGIVIDDAAVTPKYVTGPPAAREIPIVAKIAAGSLISNLVILLPDLLLLQAFAPRVVARLLILGGAYLFFEGAEKFPGDTRRRSSGHRGLIHSPRLRRRRSPREDRR
jgi:predicted DNA repair protein MutK